MRVTTDVQLPAVHPFAGMDVNTALAQRIGRLGDKPLLIWEPGAGEPACVWTYREFGAEVDRMAAGMSARGVGPGDAVLLLLDNSPAFLFSWFACARLGAVAVDTNSRYAPDELRHAIEITGAVGAITRESFVPRLQESGAPLTWTETVGDTTGTCPALYGDPATLRSRPADPGLPLCVQFTSGTTARPKAVLLTHANMLWAGRVGASHGDFDEDDVTLIFAPLFHTLGLTWLFWSTFWVGGSVVLQPKFSASRFWEMSLRHRCTVTSVLGIMLATLKAQDVPEHQYRTWTMGVETPSIEERYGIRLFNGWGMTETVTQVIINALDYADDPGAIGRVAPEYQIRVVRDDGLDAAPGDDGDLLVGGIRGLSVFAEYLHDADATNAAFDERGFFRTGDRVRLLQSGAVQFVSRAKDMLRVGGENVAAGEIERVLLGVPGVTSAAVVGRPDPLLEEVAVGFITLDSSIDESSARDAAALACARQLADFKVPREIYVIDELPEGLLGKIAKVKLRDEAVARQVTEGGR